MPIYEFECPIHGEFERIFALCLFDEVKNGVMCDFQYEDGTYCGEVANKVWSIPGNIQIAPPTRIFINNRTGDVFTPTKRFDKPPAGYHEQELKNPIERGKFEKEQQQRVDARNQFISHHLDTAKSETRKNRHNDLKAKMNAVQREIDPNTGETVEFTLDHKDKALLEKAMNKSSRKKFREKKSTVALAVNHMNQSNLSDMEDIK